MRAQEKKETFKRIEWNKDRREKFLQIIMTSRNTLEKKIKRKAKLPAKIKQFKYLSQKKEGKKPSLKEKKTTKSQTIILQNYKFSLCSSQQQNSNKKKIKIN